MPLWIVLIRDWTYPVYGPFKSEAAAEKWADGYRYGHKVEVHQLKDPKGDDAR